MSDKKRTQGKRGPKTNYSSYLGDGVRIGRTFPVQIHENLKRADYQRLLNWMAMDPIFETKILAQVPKEQPPEPGN